MIDHIKRIVSEFLANIALPKYGVITAYNPANYTVKVQLLPEGIETGFIPLEAVWVGNNLGAVFGPGIGDSVRLSFIEGSVQATVVSGRFFNNGAAAPLVLSGQAAIVDSMGSYVRLNNDGTITLGASSGITSTTPLLKQVGNFEVDGTAHFTGQATSDVDFLSNGKSGHNHTHGGVTSGAANTAPPN
jgi:uncharacterized protein involved in type VI secretion and phage assembly